MVAYVVAAVNAGKKSNTVKLTDFLLKWSPRRRQSAQEQLAIFKALAAATEGAKPRDDR